MYKVPYFLLATSNSENAVRQKWRREKATWLSGLRFTARFHRILIGNARLDYFLPSITIIDG